MLHVADQRVDHTTGITFTHTVAQRALHQNAADETPLSHCFWLCNFRLCCRATRLTLLGKGSVAEVRHQDADLAWLFTCTILFLRFQKELKKKQASLDQYSTSGMQYPSLGPFKHQI